MLFMDHKRCTSDKGLSQSSTFNISCSGQLKQQQVALIAKVSESIKAK